MKFQIDPAKNSGDLLENKLVMSHPQKFNRTPVKSTKICIAVFLMLSFAFISVQVGQAQAGEFGNKSLKGKYSFTGTGVGGLYPESIAGIYQYDGAGNGTGFAVWNRPDFTGDPETDRTTVKVDLVATYEINPDGSGTGTATASVGGVDIGTYSFNFVITKRKKGTTIDKALEFFATSDDLDPQTGNLSILTAQKL